MSWQSNIVSLLSFSSGALLTITLLLSFHGQFVISTNSNSSSNPPKNYSALVVFGDSYSDNGHLRQPEFQASFSEPPSQGGRYCDGPVWNEFLALKLSLQYNVTLLNYAYNGAHINNQFTNNIAPKIVPDTASQIQIYLQDLKDYIQKSTSQETVLIRVLHVWWIGINPLITLWRSVLETKPTIDRRDNLIHQIIQQINLQVDQLVQQIALLLNNPSIPNFECDYAVFTLPPLHMTRLVRDEAIHQAQENAQLVVYYIEIISRMIQYFNQRLTEVLTAFDLKNNRNNQKIAIFDSMAFWTEVDLNPNEYQISSFEPCLPDPEQSPCDKPSAYEYWDKLHPSTAFHAYLSDRIINFLEIFNS
ncbi:hypothetical protein O181_089719 [Austropuccinia psidii MF-1]|uniref:Carbohydrate esterase family 16 protein n=1 Tax=Austropuccinia psidii MF-1 TaxID=1389203 RepID=A0A9Q3IU23_9BASI|nr:hypothetical protein [Austropuccinia psidii MF-1]